MQMQFLVTQKPKIEPLLALSMLSYLNINRTFQGLKKIRFSNTCRLVSTLLSDLDANREYPLLQYVNVDFLGLL